MSNYFQGLYFAGLFLSHTGKHDKAKEYVTRSIQMNGKYKEVGYSYNTARD